MIFIDQKPFDLRYDDAELQAAERLDRQRNKHKTSIRIELGIAELTDEINLIESRRPILNHRTQPMISLFR